MGEIDSLYAITPIDGRYEGITKPIQEYFSEYALIKNRVMVEIRWLITLSNIKEIKEIELTNAEVEKLEEIYINFNIEDARKVKEIEKVTKHDVKAVEYYLQDKVKCLNLERVINFIHFAATSEDINNLAYSIMVRDSIINVWLKEAKKLLEDVRNLAKENKDVSMLSHTHGQSASPTTVGKELAIFVYRWESILKYIENINLKGKFSGAVGNFNAHIVAYPNIDWISIAKNFVESFGLEYNMYTTQIESHDTLTILLNMISSFNMVTMDLNSDMWIYISKHYFKQKVTSGEIGSSVMPHKINPINHENSMANIRISNGLIKTFAENLPVSRMQRDLSDSSMLRNIGTSIAHSLISIKQTQIGISKMEINKEMLEEDLNNNPEVLAEAIQTILRKNGYTNAYELLKEKTKGKRVSLEELRNWFNELKINEEDKERLKKIEVKDYTGLAKNIVEML